MSKLDKAKDFYLRGFSGEYIYRRTGIRIQSLLKQLLSIGERYSKNDIYDYQTDYIKSRYSKQEIIDAYKSLSDNFDDIYLAGKKKQLMVLGCCFGKHAIVFKRLLGEEEYNKIRNVCWKSKQTKTVKAKYGVSNVFEKSVFSDFVSDEAVKSGRLKRNQTMLEKYGVLEPLQNQDIKNQMIKNKTITMKDRYGVESAMQIPEIAMKSSKKRQEVMLKKYGVKNSVESKEIRDKIFDSRRKNHTLNSSLPENVLYKELVILFGTDDVFRNIKVDDRYPYAVDFYIKSRDLFIELNGDKAHNTHWFDENSKRDLQIVNSYHENMIRLESETNKKSRYRKYIETWTVKDLEKRDCARKHNLNYLVFWDGRSCSHHKKQVPILSDFYEWKSLGCPDSKDFHKINTY